MPPAARPAATPAAHGVAVSCQFWYSANFAFSDCSTRRAIAASSALACASDAPGASRASTLNCRTLRGTVSGSPPQGIQRSVPMSTRPGGITPTIDAARPLTRIARFRIAGSPPNRLCQSRWLMIAAGGPFGPSSSRVKPRPRAGVMPITGNMSSSSRAVKTRSGTSPPEMLRLPEIERADVREAAVRPDVEVLGRRQRLDVGRL